MGVLLIHCKVLEQGHSKDLDQRQDKAVEQDHSKDLDQRLDKVLEQDQFKELDQHQDRQQVQWHQLIISSS